MRVIPEDEGHRDELDSADKRTEIQQDAGRIILRGLELQDCRHGQREGGGAEAGRGDVRSWDRMPFLAFYAMLPLLHGE